MKKYLLLLVFCTSLSYAQDDLLNEIDTDDQTEQKVSSSWKTLKIVNLESTKLAAKGDLMLVVSHRFGSVDTGIKDLFGLDNAVTRIQFIYGLTDWMHIEASRSSFQKTYDVGAKFRIKDQIDGGFPFTIGAYTQVYMNTQLDEDIFPNLEFENRLGYNAQVLISRKFNKKFSMQIAPTIFHDNYTPIDDQDNTQYAVGVGARYKLAKRWALVADYAAHLNRSSDSPFNNPLSIGVNLETGGHVFQMHFSNSQGMINNYFLGQAAGDWSDTNFFFGFNLARTF